MEINGTLGTAIYVRGKTELYFHDGRRETCGDALPVGLAADPMAAPHDAHLALLTDFFDALDERRAPVASGRESLRVHYLIDALLTSSRNGSPAIVRQ